MNPRETKAVLRLLYAVASADGTLTNEERRALAVAADDLREELLEGPVDIAAETSYISSTTAKLATLEAAVALAVIDGRCTPEEHMLLEQIREAFALEIAVPITLREETWEARTREARAALRSAEVDFLHALSKKQGSLSPIEYQALVFELQRTQIETLHEVLDSAFEGRPSYLVLPPA